MHVRQQCAQPAGTVRRSSLLHKGGDAGGRERAARGMDERTDGQRLGRRGGAQCQWGRAVSCAPNPCTHPPWQSVEETTVAAAAPGRGCRSISYLLARLSQRFPSGSVAPERLLLTCIGQSCSMADADSRVSWRWMRVESSREHYSQMLHPCHAACSTCPSPAMAKAF